MENESNKTVNAIAIVNPTLYGELSKYLGMQGDSSVKLLMQLQSFSIMTALQMLKATSADAIIIDPHVDGFNLQDFMSLRQKSETPLLLVAIAYAGADMEQFLNSGVDATYTLPLNEESARRMTIELPEKASRLSTDFRKGAWDSISPQEIRNVVSQAGASNWQKSVISVWSPKGGVGKTTVAVELASILAGIGGRNVCILDTNLNGGHVRMRLNIVSEHSIVSVASMYNGAMKNNSDWNSAQREFNEEIEKYLIPIAGSVNDNGKSNFFCIPGITTQEQAKSPYLSGKEVVDFMRYLVDYLKQRFDFVVIDVGSSVNVPLHRESFRNSDTILVVCDTDSAGIADTHQTINKILSNALPKEKFSLVLNKWKENLGVNIKDVSNLLGITVRGFIQDDYLGGVTKAGNSGYSYVVANNKKADNPIVTEHTMQGFINLAATFYPPISAAWDSRVSSVKNLDKSKLSAKKTDVSKLNKPKKKGLFGKLFGGKK